MGQSTDRTATSGDRETRETQLRRRGLLTLGAGLGVTMLAGCTSQSGSPETDGTASDSPTSDGTDGSAARSLGGFRLLISDQPVAIDEFDSLTVSFDRARIFRATGTEETSTPTGSATASGTPTASPTTSQTPSVTPTASGTPEVTATEEAAESQATDSPTPSPTETEASTPSPTETEAAENEDDDDVEEDDTRGFSIVDLEGESVDLTDVIGEKAIGVFDGELQTGRYTKIELYAASVEGIVDGEEVDVKIPSEKLKIVKPFEVVAGETLSFVFDITVVKKGNGGYNLLPVISESGVAGEDVDVTEVGGSEANSKEEEEGTEDDEDAEESEDGEDDEAGSTDDDGPGKSGEKDKSNKNDDDTETSSPTPTETQ
jgi:hypothetical protein